MNNIQKTQYNNENVMLVSEEETGNILLITGPTDRDIEFDTHILDGATQAPIRFALDAFQLSQEKDGPFVRASYLSEFYHRHWKYQFHFTIAVSVDESVNFDMTPNEIISSAKLDLRNICIEQLKTMVEQGAAK